MDTFEDYMKKVDSHMSFFGLQSGQTPNFNFKAAYENGTPFQTAACEAAIRQLFQ